MRRVVLSALLIAVALAAWWLLRGDPGRPEVPDAPAVTRSHGDPASAAQEAERTNEAAPPPERTAVGAPDVARGHGALRVRVTRAPDDAPLPCATVRVVARDGRSERSTEQMAATDARGEVTFPHLDATTWQVAVDRGVDGGPETVVEVLAGTTTEVALQVPAGITALVRVRDSTGSPVPDAAVMLWPASRWLDGPQGQPGQVVGHTDHRGELILGALPHLHGHGSWVVARHPALGTSAARMVASPESESDRETRVIELALGLDGSYLDLLVTDPDGSPCRDAVAATQPVGAPSSRDDAQGRVLHHVARGVRTDGNGRAVLGPLAPGDYFLTIRAKGCATWHERLQVDGTGRLASNVQLQTEARLRGVVTGAEGAALEGVEVGLDTGHVEAHARTAADGTFLFDGLAAGRAEWIARHPAHRPAKGTIELVAGVEVGLTVSMQGLVALRGRLLAEDGSGLVDWGIGFRAELPGYADQRSGKTGADGAFEVPVRSDLGYAVQVAEPGQWIPIHLPERGRVRAEDSPLDLRIADSRRATAYVEGRVVDRTGHSAIAETYLWIQGHGVQAHPGSTTHPVEKDAATGRFRLGPLQPGTYVLRFSTEDRLQFEVPDVVLRPGSTTDVGRIVPPESGVVCVELQSSPDVQLGDVLVQFTNLERGGSDGMRIDRKSLTASTPLLPGRYDLEVYGDGFRSLRGTIEVRPGETATFRGTLRRAVRVGLTFWMPDGEDGILFIVRDAAGELVFDAELEAGEVKSDWWPGLELGRHSVEATGASGRRYRTSFQVPSFATREKTIDIRVAPVR